MAYSARSWDANASNLDCACSRLIPGFKSPIAPGNEPQAAIGFRERIGPESRCYPYFDIRGNRAARMAESGRENADNRVGIIVELHLSPQNSGISAEPSGPQTIADHDRFRETLRLVTRAKHPPDVRGSAEHGKIVRADDQQLRDVGDALNRSN